MKVKFIDTKKIPVVGYFNKLRFLYFLLSIILFYKYVHYKHQNE